MRNYFVFDQYDSRDFGVYISGTGTFASPTREYENIVVPGRNGDLLGLEHRLENVTLTYPAFMYADFKNGMTALRSALLSVIGYAKLYDTYHPDEYRLAVYKGGLEPDVVDGNYAGQFDLTFECLPQRFLVEGDTVKVIGQWGETQTATGEVVTINNEGGMGFKSVAVTLTPKQSGTGDPSPTNIRPINGYDSVTVTRTGKNLLHTTMAGSTFNGITFAVASNGTFTAKGTATAAAPRIIGTFFAKSGVRYTANGCPSGGSTGTYRITISGFGYDTGSGYSFTGDGASHNINCDIYPSAGAVDLTFKPMIRPVSITDPTYEPYQSDTYPIILPQTVYGGELDAVSGKLIIDTKYLVIDGSESWQALNRGYRMALDALDKGVAFSLKECGSWMRGAGYISGRPNPTGQSGVSYTFTAGTYLNINVSDLSEVTNVASLKSYLSSHNLQICYELATPIEITLTPQQITALLGQNVIWSDGGNVTVEYGEDAYTIDNTTLFDALPLIRVYGYGELGFGDYTITVAQSNLPYIDIDCDLMECYCENINANSYVSFSSVDFPVLSSGVSGISYPNTITKVEITPKTWRP